MRNLSWRFWVGCGLLMVFSGLGVGQSSPPDAPSTQTSSSPQSSAPLPPTRIASTHKFWDKENAWLFSGVAVMRALDYTSTKNMLARGREELLIPDDVVNSEAGFPALEAAGAATSVGISYIFHRTGHHKMERWLSIGHICVTGFGAAHNYALKTRQRAQ